MSFPITGLHSHNFNSYGEQLIATRGNKSWAYKSGAWYTGATLLAALDKYMASFLDKVFIVDGGDANYEYNGTYWTASENTLDSPPANYVFALGTRLFLGGVSIRNGLLTVLSWASRVWFCDLPQNGTITWGLEYGPGLVTTAGSAVVTVNSSTYPAFFVDRNIKIGDPLYIFQGTAKRNKPYTVQSIDSQTQLTLTENLPVSSTGNYYWVGGNWFDVNTDDGDVIKGFGTASNELIIFKKSSVHRYNVESETLRRIKDAPGTTSPRSIINWGSYCYWYNPSGIYRTSGGATENISNAPDDIISGVATANQDEVVGWVNQMLNTVNWYLGDVTLRDGETITNCVLTLDLNSNIWAPRSYDKVITTAANWLKSSIPEVYVGDDDSGVFKMDTGTTFNGNDIPFSVELHTIYPAGEDTICTFNRIRSYIDNGPDVQIYYKLMYRPAGKGIWHSDEEWQPLSGSQVDDRVDWYFPLGSRASGVKLKFIESGGDESFLQKKFTLYYSEEANY